MWRTTFRFVARFLRLRLSRLRRHQLSKFRAPSFKLLELGTLRCALEVRSLSRCSGVWAHQPSPREALISFCATTSLLYAQKFFRFEHLWRFWALWANLCGQSFSVCVRALQLYEPNLLRMEQLTKLSAQVRKRLPLCHVRARSEAKPLWQ